MHHKHTGCLRRYLDSWQAQEATQGSKDVPRQLDEMLRQSTVPTQPDIGLLLSMTRLREHNFVSATAVTSLSLPSSDAMFVVQIELIKKDMTDWAGRQWDKACHIIAQHGKLDATAVSSWAGHLFQPFCQMETRYLEEAAADAIIKPVYPTTRDFGAAGVVVDIKVEDALNRLLQDPVLLLDATRHHPSFSGEIRDVRDSYAWRTHVLTTHVENPWYFLLYSDEVEVCNPIGVWRGKHKIVFFYWSLLNLSLQHRYTPLSNIQLSSMTRAKTLASLGACTVVSGLQEGDEWPNDNSFGGCMRRFSDGTCRT